MLADQEKAVQYLKEHDYKFVEIVSVWDNDEDHIDHSIFYYEGGNEYFGYDEQPEDWPDYCWLSNLLPDNGIYQLYADGRFVHVGEAFIPDPDLVETRWLLEDQELLWQIPHTTP